jgi:predicted porin
VAFGRLDTPYKWITATTINPIPGGYVTDYTALIGTPGFLGQSVNAVPRYTFSPFSNVAYDRREANSIQYWSPTLAGFSLRAGVVANEFRPAEEELDDGTILSPESNPYMVSVGAGFDWEGLALRYAWEWHHDYFGVAYISQQTDVPSTNYPTSNDYGNKAVLMYTLALTPEVKTRIAGIGEHLRYTVSYARPAPGEVDTVSGVVYEYSRPAFYVLLHQTIAAHNIWGAYGRAFDGECFRVAMADGTPSPCVTDDVGADWIQAGYMYQFTENAQGYVAGYRLKNETSGLYVTTPSLLREGLSPGFDQYGAGLGFRFAFGADLLK